MRAPSFWDRSTGLARALTPLSRVFANIVAGRISEVGWKPPVPVICCGNATVGGAGKTTLTLDLAQRIHSRGIMVHILLRGYHGASRAPRRVLPSDLFLATGDEALLLARVAPTWTGIDRAASARCAVASGAELLLMDDGLQNRTLAKSASLLVVDGATGFGNGLLFPAGPLREPVFAAASRCLAAVVMGPDVSGTRSLFDIRLPILHSTLMQDEQASVLAGQRTLAFTGIAFPNKFFSNLENSGLKIVKRKAFPDHHVFTNSEILQLEAEARDLDAVTRNHPERCGATSKNNGCSCHGCKSRMED